MQTLHMPYKQTELEYLLADSGAVAVICLSEFKNTFPASIILEVIRKVNTSIKVIGLGVPVEGVINFKELSIDDNTSNATANHPDDLFVLLYTSGTTSAPKGVPHRYNNFLTNANLCCEAYGFTNEDKLLSAAPMTHLYGLFTLNMTLAVGASAVLLPAFSPETFVNTVKELKSSAIFAAPAHFAACFQQQLLKQKDSESVKFVCLAVLSCLN